jgi:hypothetical protein
MRRVTSPARRVSWPVPSPCIPMDVDRVSTCLSAEVTVGSLNPEPPTPETFKIMLDRPERNANTGRTCAQFGARVARLALRGWIVWSPGLAAVRSTVGRDTSAFRKGTSHASRLHSRLRCVIQPVAAQLRQPAQRQRHGAGLLGGRADQPGRGRQPVGYAVRGVVERARRGAVGDGAEARRPPRGDRAGPPVRAARAGAPDDGRRRARDDGPHAARAAADRQGGRRTGRRDTAAGAGLRDARADHGALRTEPGQREPQPPAARCDRHRTSSCARAGSTALADGSGSTTPRAARTCTSCSRRRRPCSRTAARTCTAARRRARGAPRPRRR